MTCREAVPEPLPIALRVFAEPIELEEPSTPDRKSRKGRSQREDRYVLVFDTETTTDRTQRLTFGVYRYYRTSSSGADLVCVEEGIFHADELPDHDPDGYELLCKYAKFKPPAIDQQPGSPLTKDAAPQIRLLTESQMRDLFYRAAYKNRALVVCFNLPFDISRLAVDWTEARGGRTKAQQRASGFQGGFTIRLFEYNGKPHRYRPEVQIKTIDSKRALKRFTPPSELDDQELETNGLPFTGHFLDLRTAAFALTDHGHTLESACEAFETPYKKRDVQHGGITFEYIDYCREDVEATARLYAAIRAEFRRHPIKLQPTKAYSPASIGKAYLKSMGIRPRLELQPDFPREILGHAMSAYYGGRAECRIRRTPVPVVYVDFLSMYPTVNALMGLWNHVTASRIEAVDATSEIRALINDITVEDCLNPETWRRFPALVQLKPNGDVLPVRARYGEGRSWGIGSSPLTSDDPMWFALPDLIASKLITGRTPEIIQAVKLVPKDKQKELKSVKLRGDVKVNPRTDDLFKAAIEQRRLLKDKNSPTGRFLKTFANGTSYGIYAEMVRHELPNRQTERVNVYSNKPEPFMSEINAPEHPGAFAFPPMAACITAAARLMLAILETLVTEQGSSWAVCDTDSMAIIATEHGGLIPCPGGPEIDNQDRECVRALSFEQVDKIVRDFEALNPYDRERVPGSVLEIEDENYDTDGQREQLYCYAISAKRYALYNLTDPQELTIRKHSEHGLGHLLNPTDPDSDSRKWIEQIWTHIIKQDALGWVTEDLDWLDRSALTRTTISSPQLLRPFKKQNAKAGPANRIRPYNFGLVAHPLNAQLQGLPERFLLVAPYESDPRKWGGLPWQNAYNPDNSYKIISDKGAPEQFASTVHGRVIVKTYRTVLAEYRIHPESKSLAPNGHACGRETFGLLARRPVKVAAIHYIGKEANKIEDAQSGLITNLGDVLTEYRTPDHDPLWMLVVRALNRLPVTETAAAVGVSERTLKRARAGEQLGRAARATLTAYAIRHARAQLKIAGVASSPDPESLLTAYVERETTHQEVETWASVT